MIWFHCNWTFCEAEVLLGVNPTLLFPEFHDKRNSPDLSLLLNVSWRLSYVLKQAQRPRTSRKLEEHYYSHNRALQSRKAEGDENWWKGKRKHKSWFLCTSTASHRRSQHLLLAPRPGSKVVSLFLVNLEASRSPYEWMTGQPIKPR